MFQDKKNQKFSADFAIELSAKFKDEKHEKLKDGAKHISNGEISIPSRFQF